MISTDNIRSRYEKLFGWCGDSMIKSYFEGYIGTGYAEKENEPAWAAVRSGDYLFLAGGPENISGLVSIIKDGDVIIPEKNVWLSELDSFGIKFKEITRYKLRLSEKGLDREKLESEARQIARFKRGSLRFAGKEEYEELKNCDWENSFVTHFRDFEDFEKNGFACCAYQGTELVSAASTFGYYSRGYELQIATRPDSRQLGFAKICAAAFLLECLKRGKTPHWDAAHPVSSHLAQELGFEPDGEYTAYIKA
ncbi:MAG: GNAT family N-acetyltransferase [Ruminococcus sp.]|nr:GNAT family N-acetyltransferase [Ruminococcus sp.]MBR4622797.1 GNAT family N-acetyltransferase [Ruminococcus sp.]